MISQKFDTGYASPLECCNCESYEAKNSDACLFTSNDGLIYFHCGECDKKCKVKACNCCFPNQKHICKWCGKKDVSHQDKDCPLLKQITLTPEQREVHINAQNQAQDTRRALILAEKNKLILENEAENLKSRLKFLEEIVKKQQLQILTLIDALAQGPKLIRQEVRKQLGSQANSSTALVIYEPNK